MYNSISGRLTAKNISSVYLTNSGIEWSLEVSNYTLEKLPPLGHEVKIFTYLHHKEDSMMLFGFSSEKERNLFLDLNKVNGVGPKAALKILSGSTPDKIMEMLDSKNATAMSQLPGLGAKTAEKIVLRLGGKLSFVEEGNKGQSKKPVKNQDIVDSLIAMGFDKKQVEIVVAKIGKNPDIALLTQTDRDQAILKEAIVALSTAV